MAKDREMLTIDRNELQSMVESATNRAVDTKLVKLDKIYDFLMDDLEFKKEGLISKVTRIDCENEEFRAEKETRKELIADYKIHGVGWNMAAEVFDDKEKATTIKEMVSDYKGFKWSSKTLGVTSVASLLATLTLVIAFVGYITNIPPK